MCKLGFLLQSRFLFWFNLFTYNYVNSNQICESGPPREPKQFNIRKSKRGYCSKATTMDFGFAFKRVCFISFFDFLILLCKLIAMRLFSTHSAPILMMESEPQSKPKFLMRTNKTETRKRLSEVNFGISYSQTLLS